MYGNGDKFLLRRTETMDITYIAGIFVWILIIVCVIVTLYVHLSLLFPKKSEKPMFWVIAIGINVFLWIIIYFINR